jgi:GTP pyrophosphokinase
VIHRRDCNQVSLFSDSDERTIIVNWDTRPKGSYVVLLEVTAVDRPGLLHEITGVFHNYGVNVLEGTVRTSQQRAQNVFKVEIGNKNQLGQICGRINRIKGVQSVSRARDYIFVSPFDAS